MINTRRYYTGLIYFIVMILLSILRVVFALGISDNWSDNNTDIIYTLISQVLCMGIVPFGLYIVLVLKRENKPAKQIFSDFGYRWPSLPVVILTFIAGAVFYYLTIGISSIWTTILTIIGYTGIESVGTIYTSSSDLFLWIIITACLPGIFEEFSHRGLLINTYEESSDGEAIVISALLFALMHQDIRQFGYALVGGFVIALFFVKSRSIIPPMILHFSNNAINCILDYSSQTGGTIGKLYSQFFGLFNNFFMILLLILSWIVAGVLIFFILIQVDRITSKKFDTSPTWQDGFNFKFKFRKEDIFLYSALILGVLTTVFSLIWSLMR